MRSKDMPKATDIIECSSGALCVAFLFYLGEGATRFDAKRVASSHGYNMVYVDFDGDDALLDDDSRATDENPDGRHPLVKALEDGGNVLPDWHPSSPGEGWQLAGKWDTEDGPTSVWIRPKPLPHGVVVEPAQ